MQWWGENSFLFRCSALTRNAVVRLTSLVYFPSIPSDIDQASRTQLASTSLGFLVQEGNQKHGWAIKMYFSWVMHPGRAGQDVWFAEALKSRTVRQWSKTGQMKLPKKSNVMPKREKERRAGTLRTQDKLYIKSGTFVSSKINKCCGTSQIKSKLQDY